MRFPLIIDGPFRGKHIAVADKTIRIAYQVPETVSISDYWDSPGADMPLPEIRHYNLYRFDVLGRTVLIASVRPWTDFNSRAMRRDVMSDMADAMFNDVARKATIDKP